MSEPTPTERFSPRYRGLDTWADEDVLAALWDGQMGAVAAVRAALPAIAAAAAAMADALRDPASRLAYAGAGSSGLLAMQDAMEMHPTFMWPPERLVMMMAGGDTARLRPVGLAEDDAAGAARDVERHAIGAGDVLVAVAASGTTPYTLAATEACAARGATTIAIANVPATPLLAAADHPVLVDSGPEVIAGSTRLNAGTAQKAVLGMLSSLAMTRLGHVVDGLMVGLVADNDKLRGRAVRIVAALAETSPREAERALEASAGVVKTAVLVARGMSAAAAEAHLAEHDGDLRSALAGVPHDRPEIGPTS